MSVQYACPMLVQYPYFLNPLAELITNDELKAFTPVMLQKAIQKIVKTSPEKHSRMSKQVWLFPDRSKDKIFADVQKR